MTDPISFSGGLIRAFEILAKRLRLLDDIPLRISSVQLLDPGFFLFEIKESKMHAGLYAVFLYLFFSFGPSILVHHNACFLSGRSTVFYGCIIIMQFST